MKRWVAQFFVILFVNRSLGMIFGIFCIAAGFFLLVKTDQVLKFINNFRAEKLDGPTFKPILAGLELLVVILGLMLVLISLRAVE